MRGRRRRRGPWWALHALGALAALLLVTLGPLAGARAHEDLLSSQPDDGATVSAPAVVELVLTAAPLDVGAQVALSGPDGPVAVGAPVVTGDRLVTALPGNLPAGQYRVAWQVTAADGHPVSGELGFTVTAAVGPAPQDAGAPAVPAPQGAGATAAPPDDPVGSAETAVAASESPGPEGAGITGAAVTPLLLGAGAVASGAVVAGWLVVRRP